MCLSIIFVKFLLIFSWEKNAEAFEMTNIITSAAAKVTELKSDIITQAEIIAASERESELK